MARKHILAGLMATPEPGSNSPAPHRTTKGAIGAVSRSIADLKARSVIEIDPFLIDSGGVQDRLESDVNEDAELTRSIAEYGQQVPVLVRPHPDTEGRFQIVYGRRRVLALRDLGQPVKALVRDLDDRELVLAQGQENTARRDLSFIEKVNFARQMEQEGYDRKVICDALSVDKTLISRMLAIAECIPPALIQAVGAAPSVGRDRWMGLADLIETLDHDTGAMIAMINLNTKSDRSDDRFSALWDYLSGLTTRRLQADRDAATHQQSIRTAEGRPLGQAALSPKFVTLRLRRSQTDGFEEWLLNALPGLHSDWQAGRRGSEGDPDPDAPQDDA